MAPSEHLRMELIQSLVGITDSLSFLKPMTAQFINECLSNSDTKSVRDGKDKKKADSD